MHARGAYNDKPLRIRKDLMSLYYPWRWRFAVLAAFMIASLASALAQTNTAASATNRPVKKLYVQPSSGSLAGGKARLIVSSLSREGSAYVGDYQIKVVPYFFKNEKGKLSISISDAALNDLTERRAVECSGKAVTNVTNKTRPVKASAVPATAEGGALKITVLTDNGPLVFDTSYQFRVK